jgi:hypothetical protein
MPIRSELTEGVGARSLDASPFAMAYALLAIFVRMLMRHGGRAHCRHVAPTTPPTRGRHAP